MSHAVRALVLSLSLAGVAAAEPPPASPPASPPTPSAPATPKPPPTEELWLELSGLEAPEAAPVETALKAVPGVQSVAWSVLGAEVRVVREVGKAADATLAAATAGAGATAKRVPVASGALQFEKPLHCPNCAKKAVGALTKTAGVKRAVVTKDRTAVEVAYDERAVTPEKLAQVLTGAGYAAKAP